MHHRRPTLLATLVFFCGSLHSQPSLSDAKRSLEQRNWQAAAGAFASILKASPKNVEARVGHGIALWELGQRSAALSEMKRALGLNPVHEEAQLAFGLMLQQSGDVAGGIAQYRAVLRRNPKSAEAHNWLGVAFMQRNQLTEAAQQFRRAIALRPEFARAYNNLGTTLAQAGDIKEGIEVLRSGLKRAPDDLQLRLNLGSALRTAGEFEEALQHLESVLRRSPGDPELHHHIALTLRQKGDLDGAVHSFESALRLNPEYRDSYYGLGQTLRQMAAKHRPSEAAEARSQTMSGLALARKGDLPAALTSFTRAIELDPNLAEAHYHLGVALWYSHQQAKAASALDKAIQLNPAAADAYSLRAVIYRDSGDNDTALRMAQRAAALDPALPGRYFDLGILFLRKEDPGHALGQFEAGLNLPATAIKPPDLDLAIKELRSSVERKDSAEGRHVLGRLLGLSGANPKSVVTELERAIAIDPEYAAAYNSLGLVYTQTGEDPKAISAFRAAIRHKSEYPDAHANLGAILIATDVTTAVRELELALKLQPGFLKAQYNLAMAYGASPDHGTDKAIDTLRKLIAMDANYPRGEFALGKELLRKGNAREALEHLERAVRSEPQFGEAHYQFGLTLSRLGRREEAAAALQRGRDLIATAQTEQAMLLDMKEASEAIENGQADEALAKLERITKQKPELADAHYQMSLALTAKKDHERARAALLKTLELNPAHESARRALTGLPAPMGPSQVSEIEARIREGKFSEAETLADAYLRHDPNSSWAWYALGYSHFAQHKIGESIKALSKSLALDVRNGEAHKVLGRNLMMIGRFDVAQREFELGARYAPDSAEMQYNLGKLFSIQDQWPAAKEAFERALKLDATYMEAHDGLGFALEALGDDKGAIARYYKAAQLNEAKNGSFSTPYVNLSALHNRTAESDLALDFARKAIAVNPRSDRGWFQMGRALERKGDLEGAVNSVKRAIDINARASSYYYVLGTLYRRLGKTEESRAAMDTFTRLDRESNQLEEKRREALRREELSRE